MIDFEEELKKFRPSLEVDEAEAAIFEGEMCIRDRCYTAVRKLWW